MEAPEIISIISLILSTISILSGLITIIWSYVDRTNRKLKYKIFRYLLDYCDEPSRTKLPTTKNIIEEFNIVNKLNKVKKLKEYRENKICNLLAELNLENKIRVFPSVDNTFMEYSWKANLILSNNPKGGFLKSNDIH